MIKLHHRPPEPDYLQGPTVSTKKAELEGKIGNGENLASADFPAYWLNADVREPLWNLHRGKCCYCERKRGINRESDIEHYRPKAAVKGENHPGYWWLAYEWTNYLFSCKICNQTYKGNYFPLLPGSARATGPTNGVSIERPVLLNPIDDEPEDCISYDWGTSKLYVKALGADADKRGLETIMMLGLNDQHLMEERAQCLSLLCNLHHLMIYMILGDNQAMIAKYAAVIFEQTSAKMPFAGFRRAYFKGVGLEEYIAND